MRTGLNTTIAGATAALLLAGCTALAGCTMRQDLNTPELRTQAVNDEFAQLAKAMNAHDVKSIEGMACEAGARPIHPSQAVSEGTAPLDVIVDDVRRIGSDVIDIDQESPDAEFHYGSLSSREVGVDSEAYVADEAIIRVDDHGACVWALDMRFLLFSLV